MEKRKRENYHLIEIRYLPPTNHRGSRVSLHSPRFDDRLTIPYDYYYANIWEMAEIHLIKKGFEIVGLCETKKGYGLLTTTFKPLKDERKEN